MPFPLRTRRNFLQGFALAGASALAQPSTRKRILILGGTGFLGPATVEAARARGHEVTLFNRGKTRPDLFPDVEKLMGDRDPLKGDGLKSLAGTRWDAVIDNSGMFPRHVSASAQLLAPNVKQYVYISSISAYDDNSVEGADETARLATIADPTIEDMGKQSENYGALKALCEQAAERAMPGRAAIIRPGFIVGPDDPSGRFTYWPVRVDRGGEVLAPGAPSDPIQLIDVRDLGAWLIKVVEDNTVGTFNATGPEKRMTMGAVLAACQRATDAKSEFTWVPADFLKEQGIHFPIWVPYREGTKGFHTRATARAIRAGLRFRLVDATAKDTLAWYKSQDAEGRRNLAGPTPQKEADGLDAWKKMRQAVER